MEKKERNLIVYFEKYRIKELYYISYFLFFNLIFNINIVFSQLFKFPQSITLLNGNIFIIHSKGIDIYDSSFSAKNETIIYSENFINDTKELSKITISRFSVEDLGLIISTINNSIYIFDYKGKLLFIDNETDLNGDYYTIVPFKRESYKFIYMIGFVNQTYGIDYIFYTYNYVNKSNEKSKFSIDFGYNTYYNGKNIQGKGLSCQLMSISEENEIITCFVFFHDVYNLTLFFIDPKNYSFINSTDIEPYHLKIPKHIKVIKSLTSLDKKKSLVCYLVDGYCQFSCIIYSIINNSFSEPSESIGYCKNDFFFNIYYMRETEQYLLLCPDYNAYVALSIYDQNLLKIQDNIINIGNDINGVSVIYSYSKQNYFIISDSILTF